MEAVSLFHADRPLVSITVYIYMFVGVNLSLSSMLARFHTPAWLFFTGFVGSATIAFSFTGFCIMANLLYRLGAEPRLCRYI